jgi:hypothetical protein
LLFLTECPQAANEIFFLTSGEAIRVGDLARRIGDGIDVPTNMLTLPAWCWRLARQLAWMPGLTRLIPWRLLHVLDDGLWCDNAKVRRLHPAPFVGLEEGLTFTFPASQRLPHAQSAYLCPV